MLKNNLKVAFRNLRRSRSYALINVVGLSIGLACSFFILLFVLSEVRYDRFHEHGDRLYRVMRNAHFGDNVYTWSAVPRPLAEELERSYPEVEHAMLLTWQQSPLLTVGDRSVRAEGYYAGPAFFQMFTFPLLEGDPATALSQPDGVVLSETMAQDLFGADWRSAGVLGRMVNVDHRKDFQVTGVAADVPDASSLQFSVLLPVEDYLERNEWTEEWGNSGMEIYVELRPGASAAEVDRKIAGVINAHHEDAHATPFLQPFTDMRLYSDYRDGKLAGGRIEFVRIFAVVAVFLLLIAAINFMNLATARSAQRAREIGVRKTVGAGRLSLVRQFLAESLLMAGFAFVLALGLVVVLLPAFDAMTGATYGVADLDPRFLLGGLAIAVVTGLLAGSYPAFYLSSFNPIAVMRGRSRQSSGTARLRRGLVVFQFALSMLLIVGTLAVYRQVHYIRSVDLGLDRENVAMVALEGPAHDQYEAFRQELLRQPGIEAVSAADQNPLNVGSSTTDPTWEGKAPDDNTLFYVISADYDFLETMGMEVAEGRTFSRAFGSDTANYVINERAAAAMGFEDPVGQTLSFWDNEGQVIGVVEDFHMNALYAPIEPPIIRLDPPRAWQLYVRTKPGQTAEALAGLKAVYAQFNPGYPFEYEFLDANYEQMYRGEMVMGKLANVFAVIAIVIACLGLLGLAAFTAEQRTKEIGVRKVLGASEAGLVTLLSRDFMGLIALALVIATPVAWWAVHRWLDGFTYHAALGAGIFVVAGGVVLVVALLTVGTQALRAATADPVKALRYE